MGTIADQCRAGSNGGGARGNFYWRAPMT